MNHYTTPRYWDSYHRLSSSAQKTADKHFEQLKQNSRHPSLHLKKIERFWSVRAGINFRALGLDSPTGDGIVWFWIGSHNQYDKLISQM